VSRRKEERLSAVPAGCLNGRKRAALAAFPSGDLPKAPGGEKPALSRVAMAPGNYFPPPPKEGAALHRQAK
jgi:hypothetical protein